jgi:sulfite exporter TauE/SafE
MSELTLIAAFVAGLFGSTHCLGMCGGVAAALGSAARPGRRWQALLYNGGRLLSYGTAGALAAALGSAAGFAFAVARWSAILRLATAAIVVVIGVDIALGTSARVRWLRMPERWGALAWRRFSGGFGGCLPVSPAARALVAGIIWGWLPCGLVYSVLLAAALAGNPGGGAATMVAFGCGTLPAMVGLSYAGQRMPRPQGTVARLLGALLVACGLWTAILPIAVLTGQHEHHHSNPGATLAH